MATDLLGSMRVEIVGDNKKLDKSIDDSEKKTKAFSKASVIAYAAIAAAVVALGAKAVKAFAVQEQAEAKLNATIKSTGQAAGLTTRELLDMASGLQEVTKFGDEAIIGAETLLLTFKDIGGETFPRALESILDVSEAMGTGLKESTIQVGKALNDPIQGLTALRRVGIQFSDTQEDLIKNFVATNRLADAQDIILGELESQFGGVARAAGDTATGALTQLGNALGDTNELVGQAIAEGLEPMARATTGIILQFNEWTKAQKEVQDAVDKFNEGTADAEEKVVALEVKLQAATISMGHLRGEYVDNVEGIEELRRVRLEEIEALKQEIIEANKLALQQQTNTARDKQGAQIQSKIAADRKASDEAFLELAERLEARRQAGLTDSEKQIELLNAEISAQAELRAILREAGQETSGVQALINDLVRERNELLNEQNEATLKLHEDTTVMFGTVRGGLLDTNALMDEQIAKINDMNTDFQALANEGLGAFASAFQMVGEEGVTAFDVIKQAGKDAGAAVLKSLARQALARAALAFAIPFGAGIPTAIKYGAAATLAFAGAGIIQNLAGGGVVAGTQFGKDSVPAMLSPTETVMNPRQQAEVLMAIANGGGHSSGGRGDNNTINISAMFSLGNDAKLNEAAERLFPALQKVGQRRGEGIGGTG